ncbi:NAD(P)H dehydrogenase B2 [Trifolium medium]|uniref:NAD(P)H dehydrogenase B2 n=1 Tax=Trifolium medium TaxID=97028 RepID=A0A392R7M2_9FABA|nr:NAD(P)H dehydrogenase B2 [Trifolium medium]
MVFTPLLASTCVGTLEFRSVAEPIGRIQPAISREPGSYFFLANLAVAVISIAVIAVAETRVAAVTT